MAIVSAIFWVIGFILSVSLAPQLRIWTWGPTMFCFAVAILAALPAIWNSRSTRSDLFIVISGTILVSWIAIRATVSPVAELAQSDLLLLAMSVATFICFRAFADEKLPQKILLYGLVLTLLASLVIIGKQIIDPTYSPIFPNDLGKLPAGFFAHYSYGASFLIPVSLLVAATAVHSKDHWSARIIFGFIALAGMAAVYFTKSRGGFVGIGAGFITLCALSILIGYRQGKKWSVAAVILFPLILIGLAFLFLEGLLGVLQTRGGTDVTGMLDNTIRFSLLQLAVSCFGLHPLFGGGSRSFSWECFQFWDTQAMGKGSARPEHVHNELVQTACDYGAIGAGLLIIFLVGVVIVSISRIVSPRTSDLNGQYSDSWRIGGISGLVGLSAQSNFEGIFRIPPGAILLGFCIAAVCFSSEKARDVSTRHLSNAVVSIVAIAAFSLLVFFGWKGSLASTKLWPVYFSHIPPSTESGVDAVAEAIAIWPLESLYEKRGALFQKLAAQSVSDNEGSDLLEAALSDFRTAEELNPYDPWPAVRSAMLLSNLNRNEEAKMTFTRAIGIQGEMEAAFQANSLLAKHLYSKGINEFSSGNNQPALNSFQSATIYTEKVVELYGDAMLGREQQEMRVRIHESWGQVLEKLENPKGAIEQYDFASTLRHGNKAHYRAGVLLGKRAVDAWSERRSEDALALFLMALERTENARDLPSGTTREQRVAYVNYLKKTIAYLEGARIKPSENPRF